MIQRIVLLIAALAAISLPAGAAPPPLHVSGIRLLDSSNQPVVLRGVNVPGLEWSNDGDHSVQSAQEATGVWHARIIRVPLSEDRWFGKAPGQTDGGAAYRSLVHDVVKTAADNGAYAILDLHWSDGDAWGQDIGQHRMPDEHSVLFWKSVAGAYANAPSVLFDLYNEPHDISWDVWQHGGSVTDHSNKDAPDRTYQSPGMQALLDTIRATGAKNVVLAGGLDWASDFSGLFTGHTLSDPAGNVVYADHFYPFGGETVAQWTDRMQWAAAHFPIFVGEFGTDPKGGHGEAGPQWIQDALSALDSHGWNWTAWCLHPQASPCLIADWNYTPTPYFGDYVKEALAGSSPPATAQATRPAQPAAPSGPPQTFPSTPTGALILPPAGGH